MLRTATIAVLAGALAIAAACSGAGWRATPNATPPGDEANTALEQDEAAERVGSGAPTSQPGDVPASQPTLERGHDAPSTQPTSQPASQPADGTPQPIER